MLNPKPPFKCLYDNDTTNIVRCLFPDSQRRLEPGSSRIPLGQREIGHEFNDEMLEASIDEAARSGVDAQKLSPGHSWVAWWKSRYMPAEGHYRWFEETYGQKPDAYGQYMLAGGDMVATFVRRCRERNIAPFISFRTNQVQAIKENARENPQSPFPLVINPGQRVQIELDMAPPAGGWRGMGKCRIQALHSFADRAVTMRLNGKALTPTLDTEDPYSHGYSPDAVLSLNDRTVSKVLHGSVKHCAPSFRRMEESGFYRKNTCRGQNRGTNTGWVMTP